MVKPDSPETKRRLQELWEIQLLIRNIEVEFDNVENFVDRDDFNKTLVVPRLQAVLSDLDKARSRLVTLVSQFSESATASQETHWGRKKN